VDRFRSINEGLSYAQSRTFLSSAIVCFGIWILGLWIASSPVLGWNDWENDSVYDCHLTRELGYIVHSALGAFFLPMFLMVYMYMRIFGLIRKRLRARAKIGALDGSHRRSKVIDEEDEEESVSTDKVLNDEEAAEAKSKSGDNMGK